MTCLTRIPAGIGFKQFPFISYDALPCSPSLLLSLSRSSSVVNFAPLSSSGSFSSTQFRWKYIDKFQEKKRVRFILLSLNRFCRRCIPLFCFVFHIFYENIIKSTLGHCRVTDRKKISWHIVIVSCFFCHSLSLSLLFFSFHFVSVQLNETHFTPFIFWIFFMQMHEATTGRQSVLLWEWHWRNEYVVSYHFDGFGLI